MRKVDFTKVLIAIQLCCHFSLKCVAGYLLAKILSSGCCNFKGYDGDGQKGKRLINFIK